MFLYATGATQTHTFFCFDDATGVTDYTADELAYVPLACANSAPLDQTYARLGTAADVADLGEPIDTVHLRSLMLDSSGGDAIELSRLRIQVR